MWWLSLFACEPDRTPTWAFDPIWVEPAEGGAIHGFHTWQLYGPLWDRRYEERHYACSVLAELDGQPVLCDAEEGCTYAWSVVEATFQTDCDDAYLEDPLFTSLARLAFGGPLDPDEASWPSSASAWADYGEGWVPYGEAYPQALDLGAQPAADTWTGEEPFQLVPFNAFGL